MAMLIHMTSKNYEPALDSDDSAEVREAESQQKEDSQAIGQEKPAKKPHQLRQAIMIFFGIVIFVGIAYYQGYFNSVLVDVHLKKSAPVAARQTPKPRKGVTTVKLPTFADSYLDQPQLLNPQPNFFSDYGYFGYNCDGITPVPNSVAPTNCPAYVTQGSYKYYRIGTTSTGMSIIVADGGQASMLNHAQTYLALQTGSSTFLILAKPSNLGLDNSQLATLAKALDPSTTLDTTTILPDLALPTTFTFQNTGFEQYYTPSGGASYGYPIVGQLTAIRDQPSSTAYPTVLLGQSGAYSVYRVTEQSGAGFEVHEYYLTVKTEYAGNYIQTASGQFNNTNSKVPPAISWSDGSANTANFSPSPLGCGSVNGYLVATGLQAAALTVIGKAPDGSPMYELPTTSPLFQKLYTTDYSDGTNLASASMKNLTADQLQAAHAVFVTKNGLGELIVYLSQNYFEGGGCAKPVLYLYPTHTQAINVAVSAQVRQSLPIYGPNGWTNVLASPNGQLTYAGKSYPSLYWEGIGSGEYPVIDSGIVVPEVDAVSTIQKQLSQQGFNAAETRDFLAYWEPRLPKTAYIRLSWLTTTQMNNLAPLTVSPKPQTVIRTFLDFAGLNHPEELTPQHFTSPKRQGFTVVEWGGLDRGSGLQ